jgi:hypothetical protein
MERLFRGLLWTEACGDWNSRDLTLPGLGT